MTDATTTNNCNSVIVHHNHGPDRSTIKVECLHWDGKRFVDRIYCTECKWESYWTA